MVQCVEPATLQGHLLSFSSLVVRYNGISSLLLWLYLFFVHRTHPASQRAYHFQFPYPCPLFLSLV